MLNEILKFLITLINLVMLMLLYCLLTACAPIKPIDFQMNCVTAARFSAEQWHKMTGEPTRIAITKVSTKPDIDHAQAQAFNGQWRFLTIGWREGYGLEPMIYKAHFNQEPYKYVNELN